MPAQGARLVVHGVGGLIGNEQVRLREQRRCQGDAPLLAAAHGAHGLPYVGHAHLPKHLFRAFLRLPTAQQVHLCYRRVDRLLTPEQAPRLSRILLTTH